jgi:methylglutamate dehydrogenase subunit D
MPDRVSPLAHVAIQGRHGADKGAPGVAFTVRHPLVIATVIARKGKAKALAEALTSMRGITVHWAGPDQYFVYGAAPLTKKLAGLASIADQSHGRVVIRISGPMARTVLAKGTPVDLDGSVFKIGDCALTQMAHVGVHIAHVAKDTFDLSVFRGFSESFWEWLTSQAAQYGYQVH